jgi:hypothetical protein
MLDKGYMKHMKFGKIELIDKEIFWLPFNKRDN